jgi:hypothetical protein
MTRVRPFVSRSCSLAVAIALSTAFLHATARGQDTPDAAAKAENYRPEATYLRQEWDYGTAKWWYHVSQGTVFMQPGMAGALHAIIPTLKSIDSQGFADAALM